MGTVQRSYDPTYGPVVEIEIKSPYKKEFQGVALLTAEVDSGANITAINNSIARNLQLPPVGLRTIDVPGGQRKFPGYAGLIKIEGLGKEMRTEIIGLEDIEQDRALIGRDIIDFFVTNLDGPNKILTITDPFQHVQP